MATAPKISDAEWQVMKVAWDRAPVTSNTVIEELSKTNDWDARTIKTMLNRLVKKGALTYSMKGRSYLYSPAVTREHCIREEGSRFLDRVFDGASTPLLAHFIENTDLDKKSIDELRELLNSKDTK
jgi:BlaI family penicillinase repressor